MKSRTASMPTPRPDTSLTVCAVEKPGRKMNPAMVSSLAASSAPSQPRSIAAQRIFASDEPVQARGDKDATTRRGRERLWTQVVPNDPLIPAPRGQQRRVACDKRAGCRNGSIQQRSACSEGHCQFARRGVIEKPLERVNHPFALGNERVVKSAMTGATPTARSLAL